MSGAERGHTFAAKHLRGRSALIHARTIIRAGDSRTHLIERRCCLVAIAPVRHRQLWRGIIIAGDRM
jgi:hypothetical protein